tara:strand:+ start:387 stop:1085 length:699 start_codon:yes stop_codon:yes gene_type:complete
LNKLFALFIHLLTSLGIVAGFFALLSVLSDEIVEAFLWLCLAFFIDGVDGPLARRFKVKEVSPNIKGEVLDNIVDYFNYVIVPTLIIYQFDMVPQSSELLIIPIILIASCYTFANSNLKTVDNYFIGFPALWNVVVFYIYILNTSQIFNLLILIIFCLLTFVPFKYVHPFRVQNWRPLTLGLTILWGMSSLILLLRGETNQYLEIVYWLWGVISIYFLLISFKRSFFKRKYG